MPNSTSGAAPARPFGRRQAHRRGEHAAAILAAAHRLIDRQGDFTARELIREADVALRTFYAHFTSKDHLLIALIGDRIQAHATAVEEQGAELADPVERLELYVTSPLRHMDDATLALTPTFVTSEHWRLHQIYPEEVAKATLPFTDLLRRTIEEGAAAGRFTPHNAERDAWLISQMVMAVFHYFAYHPDDEKRPSAANDIWEFCRSALVGPRT